MRRDEARGEKNGKIIIIINGCCSDEEIFLPKYVIKNPIIMLIESATASSLLTALAQLANVLSAGHHSAWQSWH